MFWNALLRTGLGRMRRLRNDEAQDLIEYGLLMALIAVVAIGAVTVLGDTINSVFWEPIASNF